MTFRKIISVVFLLVWAGTTAFAHTTIIKNSGESRYKAIKLTPEIYNNANINLSDVRIKDDSSENVPYFINSGNQTKYEARRQTYPMTLINSYTKDDNFYFDYKVQNIPDRDITATAIEVTTKSTGFAKNIEIYGSYDSVNWKFVQNDSLYSIDGKSNLTIEFSQIQKYTHYRFKLGNNLEKISLEAVALVHNDVTQENIYFIESITPEFNVTEEKEKTVISVKGMYNLRIAGITINTDSMFKRTVTTSCGGNKELYNLSLNNTSYTDTTILYQGQIIEGADFFITIHNGDDKPINIKGLTVKYFADELVFEDNGSESYTLIFERNDTIIPPVYDIVRYKNEILKGDIDRLDIKEVILDEPREEPEQYNYKMIFNIVVIVVAIFLGLVIMLKLRKKS